VSLAVFASGSGSNLQALLDAATTGQVPPIALVVANVPCRALERAAAAGVAQKLVPHQDYATRDAFDAALVTAVREAGADLICLAGFMRLLTPTFLTPFAGRVLNIHPSLLPAFPGMHAQRQALEAGARLAGCSVHFVDAGTDTGPLIAQAAVPVLPDDTEGTLTTRILAQEHRPYPSAVRWVASGLIRQEGKRTVFARASATAFDESAALLSPMPSEAQ
jgi:phosphoribosylglycinamide formyltransferase-1